MDPGLKKVLLPPPLAPPQKQIEESESIIVKPGNQDRGWNDPPVFGVEMNIGGKSVPTKLNKRVAFPLSSNPGQFEKSDENKTIFSPLPPPVSTNVLFTPIPNNSENVMNHLIDPPDNLELNKSINESTEDLTFIKQTVMTILMTIFESISLEPKVKEEVKKRLEILESSWESLTDEIKLKILKLSQCLKENNYKVAGQLQRSLGSEFISQCSPWIMAIKNITRAKQEQSEQNFEI